ncbi:Protein phosphatase OS=Streptomyces alboniger OX=132473 GN=CP975_31840 PE=4 SV=1 [Streptomyces alboniger]
MGCFDWDLDTGLMTMDATAHDVFDIRPDEYDDRPETLAARVPTAEGHRLDQTVARALKDGSETYGAYFRVRHRDGALRWTHTHGCIRRDGTGRPHRIVGVVRDATRELGDSPPALRERADEEAERRRRTSLVQNTTAALAHARTVSDVIDVLKDTHGLAHLGAAQPRHGPGRGRAHPPGRRGPRGQLRCRAPA